MIIHTNCDLFFYKPTNNSFDLNYEKYRRFEELVLQFRFKELSTLYIADVGILKSTSMVFIHVRHFYYGG